MRDQIVEEIREVRKDIENECAETGHDFALHIREYQKKYSDRLVKKSPKKSLRQKIA